MEDILYKNENKGSVKTHKTYFRKMMKDERINPRVRLCAQLFLAHLEDMFPRPLLESVIEAQFGSKSGKLKEEGEIEELLDKQANSVLKEQYKQLFLEENKDESNSVPAGNIDSN